MDKTVDSVIEILARQFQLDPDSIDESTGPANVDGWDSAAHMALIVYLEDSFDVQIDDDDIASLVSVEQICAAIRKQQAHPV